MERAVAPDQSPDLCPAVSVIVPVYNRAALIAETLETVLTQRFSAFEVIVVDDGSTDDTPATVAAMAERDRRVRYIRQNNAGPGAARNTGIRAARARWIAFLDSDDFWEPDKLSNLMSMVEADPGLDFVHTNWQRLLLDGTKSKPRDLGNYEALSSRTYLLNSFSLKTSTIAIRQDLLDRIGGSFYTDSPLYEDFHLFWRAVMRAQGIGYRASCDTICRETKGGLGQSMSPETNSRAKISVMDRMCRWIEEEGCPAEYGLLFKARLYREFQKLFRLLIRDRRIGDIGRAYLHCRRVLSLPQATRGVISSLAEELKGMA